MYNRSTWLFPDHPTEGKGTTIPITIPPAEADAWDADRRAGRSAVHRRPPDGLLYGARLWLFHSAASAPSQPEHGLRLDFEVDLDVLYFRVQLSIVPVPGGTLVHERSVHLDGTVAIVEELFGVEEWLTALGQYVPAASAPLHILHVDTRPADHLKHVSS